MYAEWDSLNESKISFTEAKLLIKNSFAVIAHIFQTIAQRIQILFSVLIQ